MCIDSKSASAVFSNPAAVKSVLAVPVFVENTWWGHLGFDDCRNEREWSPTEIDTLETLAELVGAAVARARSLQKLADANYIIEKSPTILYRIGPKPPFPLTYVSQNVKRYGYDAGELLANPNRWVELIDSTDVPGMMANINSAVEGKTDRIRIDFRLRKVDGTQVWFDSEGYALRDESGQLAAIEGVLTDVTDRKQSESELSFFHILLTTAIEISPDAILIVDEDARIITYNQHFVELWGIPPELARARVDEPVLQTVASKLKNKSEFLERVRYLYDHPELQSHEEIELLDGRVVDRHSGSLYDKQQKYLGRVC